LHWIFVDDAAFQRSVFKEYVVDMAWDSEPGPAPTPREHHLRHGIPGRVNAQDLGLGQPDVAHRRHERCTRRDGYLGFYEIARIQGTGTD
jgi:hypothetical protein